VLDPLEDARLAALTSYCILDTESEDEYDDLTRLAAQICGTPMALVTLLDKDRQWFKSKVGLAASETPREHSMCAHAVKNRATLVVPDATADPRFHDNPYVTGDPSVRFYAGAPLITADGPALGALCVIDRRPRVMDPAQLSALQALSRQVVRLLELRRLNIQMAAALADQGKSTRAAVCGCCRRVQTIAGRWLPFDDYLAAGGEGLEQCPACNAAGLRDKLLGR
jgi:GAF domain-containing protein